METEMTGGQARAALATLFQEAGRELPELLDYIDKLESRNRKLEEENRKLKLASARRAAAAEAMNSRLKDALRE